MPPAIPVEALRLGVPQTYVLDGLEAGVATAFANVCTNLSRAGARIADLPLGELAELSAINASGGFAPIEAYAWHKPLLERRGGEYDPRVRTRIERAIVNGARSADRIGMATRAGTNCGSCVPEIKRLIAANAKPFAAAAEGRTYDGEIAFVDTTIGRVLDHLQQTSELDDTVVLVLSTWTYDGTGHTFAPAAELALASAARARDHADRAA